VPIERELKFSLIDDFPETEELQSLFEKAGLELSTQPTLKQFDTYYDDTSQSLRKAGLALRRRKVDGRSLATLKGQASIKGSLHQREEIEEPMLGNAWPQVIFERLETVTDPWGLQEKLELSTIRKRYLIRQKQSDMAILSFDQVSAQYPKSKQSVRFEEIEIEALEASNDNLQSFAEILQALIQISPNTTNKLERAEVLLLLSSSFGEDRN
jgi:inorganic triphosphatase YgiF